MIKCLIFLLVLLSTFADYYWRDDYYTTMSFGANYSPKQLFPLCVYTSGNVTADILNLKISNHHLIANGT